MSAAQSTGSGGADVRVARAEVIMVSYRIPRLHRSEGGFAWVPEAPLARLGFKRQVLGADAREAATRAEALNRDADRALATRHRSGAAPRRDVSSQSKQPPLPPYGSHEYRELERLVEENWWDERQYWIDRVAKLSAEYRAEQKRHGGFHDARLAQREDALVEAIRRCCSALNPPSITPETVERARSHRELRERAKTITEEIATRRQERAAAKSNKNRERE